MRHKGMSLVEVLIALAITGIIGGIVLVAYTYVAGRQLDATARALAADMVLARQRAVSLHQDCEVRFNLAKNYYRFYNGSGSSGILVSQTRCARGIDLVNVTDSSFNPVAQSKVYFSAHTGIPNQETLIHLTQNFRLRRIRISGGTGAITIEQQ